MTRAEVRAAVEVPLTIAGRRHRAVVHTFRGLLDSAEHLVLALGPPSPVGGVSLVRVHSECLTGDLFGSRRCDCGPQLDDALRAISRSGGYLVYLRQEGRGIGLYAKLDAYALQDRGLDTYAANRALGYPEDLRDYQVAAQMLLALGVERMDLLTGNSDKVTSLESAGLSIRNVRPLRRHPTPENLRYLLAKQARGHLFG
jgi:GTP cyclohydrolase II